MMEPSVFIIRHGQTLYNQTSVERIRGWLDVPLTKKGRLQAHEAGEKLKNADIFLIACSDLDRARETTSIISKILKLNHTVVFKQLRPWNLGVLSGREVKQVDQEMQELLNHPDTKPKGGESFNHFIDRFMPIFESLVEFVEKNKKNIGVVTHFRNLAVIKTWINRGMIMSELHKGHILKDNELGTAHVFRFFLDGKQWKFEEVK